MPEKEKKVLTLYFVVMNAMENMIWKSMQYIVVLTNGFVTVVLSFFSEEEAEYCCSKSHNHEKRNDTNRLNKMNQEAKQRCEKLIEYDPELEDCNNL